MGIPAAPQPSPEGWPLGPLMAASSMFWRKSARIINPRNRPTGTMGITHEIIKVEI